MMARVISALTAVRLVAERPDPLEPLGVGQIARHLGVSLSGASRLCADLAAAELLEPAEQYGAYRLGARGIRLSGRASAPTARSVQIALAKAARLTGESVCLAAATPDGARVIAAVESAWTLFVPATVGEHVDEEGCAIRLALDAPPRAARSNGRPATFESVVGVRIEIAAPIRDAVGEIVAVVAIRLPRNRTKTAATRARRAVDAARAEIEEAIAQAPAGIPTAASSSSPPMTGDRLSPIEAMARLLEQLAEGAESVAALHRATGMTAARIQRLVGAAVEAGLVRQNDDDRTLGLAWSMHGWYRAALVPTLVQRAERVIADVVATTGQSSFLTVMRRMRSVTLVEILARQPDGLAMAPWLGRPCPIQFSDGGPALLIDFGDEIGPLIPGNPDPRDLAMLRDGVRRIVKRGVLTKESEEEAGQIAVSSPVRDASGLVVAAACIVGPSEAMRARVGELESAAAALAAEVSALLSSR